jgi:hypothetical protein
MSLNEDVWSVSNEILQALGAECRDLISKASFRLGIFNTAGRGLYRIDVYGQYMHGNTFNWFIMVPYLTLNMGFDHQTHRDIIR